MIIEPVTEGFCEKFYTSLTPDFCDKMGIVKGSLSRDRGAVQDFPAGVVLVSAFMKTKTYFYFKWWFFFKLLFFIHYKRFFLWLLNVTVIQWIYISLIIRIPTIAIWMKTFTTVFLDFFSQIVYFQKYKYPKAVNILKMARESEFPRQCFDILLSVVQLVQRMHTKRWLMVALTGNNVYIQREGGQYNVRALFLENLFSFWYRLLVSNFDLCHLNMVSFQAFFLKLGGMVRMSENKRNSSEENIHVSDRFEDIIFW